MRSYSDIRYRFGPLDRRGLIGTLRPGQLLVLGSTVLLTILLVETLRNCAGLALGALFLSCGGLASFVPFGGRKLNEWVPVVATFLSRKMRGRNHWRSGAAEAGTRFLGGEIPVRPPDPIGRVELLAFPFRGVELGVLADRSNGTFTAVIQARARSFVLLDPEDKAQRLAGWANVIAGLAREGSPISRLQWLERTVPDDRNALNRYLRDALDPEIGLDALPLQSYLRLTQAAGPVTEQHELYIAMQLNAGKAARAIKQAGGKDTGAWSRPRSRCCTRSGPAAWPPPSGSPTTRTPAPTWRGWPATTPAARTASALATPGPSGPRPTGATTAPTTWCTRRIGSPNGRASRSGRTSWRPCWCRPAACGPSRSPWSQCRP